MQNLASSTIKSKFIILTSGNISWKTFRLLDDYEVLSKTYLRQQDDLLTILTSIDNDLPFSMDISYNKFPFLDIVIIKSGKQIWINIFSKPTDSKHCFLQFYSPKTLFKEYIILTCKVDMYHSRKQKY